MITLTNFNFAPSIALSGRKRINRPLMRWAVWCFGFVQFAVGGLSAQTQNYSGLLDRALSLDLNLVEIGLNASMGGDCSGNVSRVKVTEDNEMQLTLSVTYTGYQNCLMSAKLVDERRSPLPGFQAVKIKLAESSAPVELTFTVDRKAYSEGQDITASKMYITISRDEGSLKFYRLTYALNKKFKVMAGTEYIVTEVTMSSFGSSGSITKGSTRPGNVVLPNRKIYKRLDSVKVVPEIYKRNTLYLRPGTPYLRDVDSSKLNISRLSTGSTAVRAVTPAVATYRPVYINPQILTAQPRTPNQPTTPPNPDPQGPNDVAIPLFESLVTDYNFEYPFEITNIRLDVYPDKNKESGVFYFLPSAYQLLFDKENGYQFSIDYGTSGETGTEATVRMAGKLTPGIGKKEIDIVRELLKSYVSKNPQFGYKSNCELRAIQIDGAPNVSFDTDLKQYNITNQTVNAPNLSEPIDVSWRTDQANATDIGNSLKANVGIIGTMKLKPRGGTLTEQSIPVRIRLADERTVGRFTLAPGWRGQKWRNISPYPIKLTNLHVMWVNNNVPAVYTWTLGGKEIPARSQVKFNADAVPLWLDNEQNARFWLEYEILNCEPCHDSVIRNVIRSTPQAQSQQIKFKLLTFFEEFNIVALLITVRTKQADPSGESMQMLPAIHTERDAQDYMSANIYLPQGDEPDFEFRLQVITEDGSEYFSDWQQRKTLLVAIGSSQISEFFPQLVHQ